MYYALLGIAVGWITAFPAIRPQGFPLHYILLVILAFATFFIRGNKVDRLTVAVGATFLVTTAYVAIHSLFSQEQFPTGPLGRTVIGLSLFALISTTVHRARDITALVLWMSPFWFVSQIFGIAQYFGVIEAIALPIILLPEEVFEEDEEISIETIRIFGLLGLPHIFAYGSALHTVALVGVFRLTKHAPFVKALIVLLTTVSLSATVLSAQRAAVWPILLLLTVWAIVATTGLKRAGVLVFLFLSVSMATIASLAGGSGELIGLERLVSIEVGADSVRLQTWREGMRAVLTDPMFGTGYEPLRVGVGIHNGYLRGWAQFGMPWLLLVVSSTAILFYAMLESRQPLHARILPLGIMAIAILNSMSHTLMLTINDLITWSFIAIALSIARLSTNISPPRTAD